MDPAYCTHCGERTDARDHGACQRAGVLDPPRYCARCGRRMIVKVTPDRWTARCSRHGQTEDDPIRPGDPSQPGDVSR